MDILEVLSKFKASSMTEKQIKKLKTTEQTLKHIKIL